MLTVDLSPLVVNLATKHFVWQKSSPKIEYECLGKSVQGSTFIELGFNPGTTAGGTEAADDVEELMLLLIGNTNVYKDLNANIILIKK